MTLCLLQIMIIIIIIIQSHMPHPPALRTAVFQAKMVEMSLSFCQTPTEALDLLKVVHI